MWNKGICVIDLETTGLWPDFNEETNEGPHEITQIGYLFIPFVNGVIDEGKTVKKEVKVIPEHIETANPYALEINGYDKQVWDREGISLRDALVEYSELTDGWVIMGKNINFDLGFLEFYHHKLGLNFCMPRTYQKIDITEMAVWKLGLTRKIKRIRLEDICNHFGISNEGKHTALADCVRTWECWKRLNPEEFKEVS